VNLNRLIDTVISNAAQKGTLFVSPKLVAKATRRHRIDGRDSRVEFVLTLGAPNFAERKTIKTFQKAGVKFPVSKIQLKYPKAA